MNRSEENPDSNALQHYSYDNKCRFLTQNSRWLHNEITTVVVDLMEMNDPVLENMTKRLNDYYRVVDESRWNHSQWQWCSVSVGGLCQLDVLVDDGQPNWLWNSTNNTNTTLVAAQCSG